MNSTLMPQHALDEIEELRDFILAGPKEIATTTTLHK